MMNDSYKLKSIIDTKIKSYDSFFEFCDDIIHAIKDHSGSGNSFHYELKQMEIDESHKDGWDFEMLFICYYK